MQDIGSSENAERKERKRVEVVNKKSAKKQTFDLRVQEKGHRASKGSVKTVKKVAHKSQIVLEKWSNFAKYKVSLHNGTRLNAYLVVIAMLSWYNKMHGRALENT